MIHTCKMNTDTGVQTRTIEMPSDSQFAIAMKNQKEAERAEQQRIKNLVLNYDLQDSNTDQNGTDNNISFDCFPQPNPNLPLRKALSPYVVPLEKRTFAHNTLSEGLSGEKHGASHHQHNASLHQSSSATNTNARPADKSSSNRSGHRARKLQLSDVDWYEQKPGLSRSRHLGGSSPGP